MYEKLFEPLQIGKVTLKNRFHVPPMVVNYCTEDGMVTERFIRYHEEKALGGWGLITVDQSVIEREGRAHPRQPGIWSDEHIEGLSKLTKRLHDAGAKVSIQINHCGRASVEFLTGTQLVAPSAIKDPVYPETPRELTVEEIHELVEKFGDAALRAKKAGFDMVTEHVHAGYLLAAFLSPLSNKRTDEYGGTLHNRARFAIEALQNMRKKVGPDFPLAFRFSADDFAQGGMSIYDAVAFAQMMEDAGADFIDVSVGNSYSYVYIVQPSAVGHGFAADIAYAVKQAVSIPVAIAGRINEPILAESLLRTGKADLISMGRASIADPELPNKVREGRIDEIRHCIGCMQGCAGNVGYHKDLKCLVNPSIGKEIDTKPAVKSKKVLIAGGGIAGMEAAIIAAERGHDVHLYERGDRLGGQWLLAAIPPTKTELNTFTIWQKNQLKRLNVKVYLNAEVTEELIKTESPCEVIFATGSNPFTPGIPGASHANVIQATDALASKVIVGDNLLVIGGGLVGSETADHFSTHGKKVTLIEMADAIAQEGQLQTNHFLFKRLNENDVNIITSAKVSSIQPMQTTENAASTEQVSIDAATEHTESQKLKVTYEKNGQTFDLENLDNVILALGSRANQELYSQVSDEYKSDFLVGDAKKTRLALDAIEEGYLAGSQI